MADKPAKSTKPVRTLRQAASDSDKPKRRSLKAPVKRASQPLRKAGSAVRKGRAGRIAGRLVPKYFRQSWQELQEVTWPDRRQTVKLTVAVMAFATVFGLVVAVVDYGLDKLFRQLLLK